MKLLKDISLGIVNLDLIDPAKECPYCGVILNKIKGQTSREIQKTKSSSGHKYQGLCSICVQYLTKNIIK